MRYKERTYGSTQKQVQAWLAVTKDEHVRRRQEKIHLVSGFMNSEERLIREIEHGKFLAAAGAGEIWNWNHWGGKGTLEKKG